MSSRESIRAEFTYHMCDFVFADGMQCMSLDGHDGHHDDATPQEPALEVMRARVAVEQDLQFWSDRYQEHFGSRPRDQYEWFRGLTEAERATEMHKW